MSLSVGTTFEAGDVKVIATSGRGLNPDELTRMVLPKLLYVAPDASEESKALGAEMRTRMEVVLKHYFGVAQKSQNTSIFNVLMNAGHESAAEIVRSL